MLEFTKKKNVYRISQVSLFSDNNILGVCFSENNSSDIEVIPWNLINGDINGGDIQKSKDQVLKQVLSGLKEINQSLGTSYRLSKIYFVPSESPAGYVYKYLIVQLIIHYHNGNGFDEVYQSDLKLY